LLPPRLAKEVSELQEAYRIKVVETDLFCLIFEAFPTATHFNKSETELLIRVPRPYPDAGPDMFWTDEDLALENGQIPQGADSVEVHLGKRWRRFSWHHSRWNPVVDDLQSYLAFVRRRFETR
jgi:hypothetical protein